MQVIPVLLCGGSGSRLWPLSQDNHPKQFLPIIDDETLLEKTIKRAMGITASDIILVTTKNLEPHAQKIIDDKFSEKNIHVLCEEEPKGTTAAIALATLYAQEKFDNAVLWITPTDHIINDSNTLKDHVLDGAKHANSNDCIVTLGIQPDHPSSAYGYIQASSPLNSNIQSIELFIEKPSLEKAEELLKQDNIYWNSGMFIASTETFINALQQYTNDTVQYIQSDQYNQVIPSPFDITVMEKHQNTAVIPADIGWHDIGQWEKIWALQNKDDQGNHISGDVIAEDTENCFIQSKNLRVATMGLKDLIIVEHDGELLIADKNNDQAVKKISEIAKKKKVIEGSLL